MKPSRAEERGKVVDRTFPGPRGADARLRVAIERSAYAELIAHGKDSLDAEVCGVLAGQICEDDEGRFVHVEAVIRGSAATQAATHVTFTQATWEQIHRRLEEEYPKLRIVGWYHTHPGFGVEFSEMDLFIHRNFFPGAEQIALVMDPSSGDVAIAVNTPEGSIEYLNRFWVHAREQQAKTPRGSLATVPARDTSSGSADVERRLADLESRINQLILVHDEQRNSFQRFLFTGGFLICFAVLGSLGYFVYNLYWAKYEPPKLNTYIPVPLQIGDKTVLIGMSVVSWDVPKELNAVFVQLEKAEREKMLKQKGDTLETQTSDDSKAAKPAVPDAEKEKSK